MAIITSHESRNVAGVSGPKRYALHHGGFDAVTSGEDKKEKLVENKLAQDFARLTLLGLSFSDAFIHAF